jgi:Aspartyl protease
LSILRPRPDSISAPQSRAILAAASGRYQPVRRRVVRRFSPSGRSLHCLLLALFLLTPLPNRARPTVLRLPFRTAHSMIVVQARVNGSQVALLLDTGATRTVVSARVYGNVPFRLRAIERTSKSAGIVGDSMILPVNLELANHTWAG